MQETPSPAMIVCPGGGYGYVVMDKESEEIAVWLNSKGGQHAHLEIRRAGQS